MLKMNFDGRSVRIDFSMPGSTQYDAAVSLAKGVYRKVYRADINPTPDSFLVCSEFGDDRLLGCAGLSFASHGPLFSEQYLDADLGSLLKDVFGHEVSRDKVVEVTSLATTVTQLGFEMVRCIPIACWCFGMQAILCTATEHLRKVFQVHRLPSTVVATPDPARLNESSQGNWGSYYATNPKTVIVRMDRIGHLFQSHCGQYALYGGPHAKRQDALMPA